MDLLSTKPQRSLITNHKSEKPRALSASAGVLILFCTQCPGLRHCKSGQQREHVPRYGFFCMFLHEFQHAHHQKDTTYVPSSASSFRIGSQRDLTRSRAMTTRPRFHHTSFYSRHKHHGTLSSHLVINRSLLYASKQCSRSAGLRIEIECWRVREAHLQRHHLCRTLSFSTPQVFVILR